jgi:thymidylate synthase ThyX
MLPAASVSNVGIYGTGQGYEALLLRMRAHPLPEARRYAQMMLTELRKVIPSFLRRVDVADRGQAWSDYMESNRSAMEVITDRILGDIDPAPSAPVTLVDFDPDAEDKLLAAMLYPYSRLSETQVRAEVERLSADERSSVVRAYVGERRNRRHKPGRALERLDYRFDVLSDYGAFRDLQRHRLLTIEWQSLSPVHGFVRSKAIDDARVRRLFDEVMERSGSLYAELSDQFPRQAPYAVSMAYRVRYVMQFNAREAMHLIELRSSPQGHPSYRDIVQQMYRAIRDEAGHTAVAAMLEYVDLSGGEEGRLGAEVRTEVRRDASC